MVWAPIITMTIIGTILGFRVGRERGRPKLGVTLGSVFGLIGVLAIWLIPRTPQAKQEHIAVGFSGAALILAAACTSCGASASSSANGPLTPRQLLLAAANQALRPAISPFRDMERNGWRMSSIRVIVRYIAVVVSLAALGVSGVVAGALPASAA